MIKTNVMAVIKNIGMSEIFKVEQVDGEKRLNRWGFFAEQTDGTYAVYRPEHPVVALDDMLDMYDDELADINMLSEEELCEEISQMDGIQGIALMEVDANIACGWYYDTIVPME